MHGHFVSLSSDRRNLTGVRYVSDKELSFSGEFFSTFLCGDELIIIRQGDVMYK